MKDISPDLYRISALAYADEQAVIRSLLEETAALAPMESEIMARARTLAEGLRRQGPGGGIEAFLHEYGMGSEEGVMLMCLAEALLRIPDAPTADRLIQGTFESARWEKHLGRSDSFFVNASSWGLLLTGKVVQLQEKPSGVVARLAAALGEPMIRQALKKAMRLIGAQFVLGETVADGLAHAKPWLKKGFRFSYDILGEGARSDAQAQAYLQAYRQAIALIGRQSAGADLFAAPGISVKLSALHARYQLTQRDRVFAELLPRLKEILLLARQHNIAVSIDAEEATRLDIGLLLFSDLCADPGLAGWNGLGFVVQSYQKRASGVIEYLATLARRHNRIIPLRLVKGAYWDSEIKAAQIAGLPGYPVFTRKAHTDLSYLACAGLVLRNAPCFYPQFATHNARTVASIEAMSRQCGLARGSFEFQRLHGMGEALHDRIVEEGYPSRIYAPIGRHRDLLAYLIRRLLENGANTSFVHLLMDDDVPLDKLLADPVAQACAYQGQPSPLPLPVALYGAARKNSIGCDLGNLDAGERLRRALGAVANPLPPARETGKRLLPGIVQAAAGAYGTWSETAVGERSARLEAAADLLEEKRDQAMALLMDEGHKTVTDALAEVREAADFCRYYAVQARRLMTPQALVGPTGESDTLTLHPRGVFACISPWNFPLAIFTGQVAAALATGNCVVAKPAEQTPDTAAFAVNLLHEAGIPRPALQLVVGDGKLGAALVAHPLIAGVAFTGSVEVGQSINRALAARKGPIAPLIAETGGQNCMVVDSSALIEQAVDDIIVSAFGSAGQRCSSLRVLYVQEDIAGALIELLSGAMQELRLGDPRDFATDIGPVIDGAAQDTLLTHIARMRRSAKLVGVTPLPESRDHLIAPHAFEIGSIGELKGEVFGPVLHILRFKSSEMARVCEEINGTGYGLTFGMHSRIDENIEFFTSRVRAGNLYVNRSMIGATVGVQPFGGEGLSGTGPKAGGPHYLLRFLTERSLSVNTAAIGGNLALLADG